MVVNNLLLRPYLLGTRRLGGGYLCVMPFYIDGFSYVFMLKEFQNDWWRSSRICHILIFEHGNIGLVDVSWKKRPQRADVAHSSTGMSRDDGLGHAGEWWSHVGPKHGGHKISAWREGGCRSLVVWYVRPGLRTKKVSESVFLKLSRGEGKVQEHMKFWNPNDS